MTNNTDTLSLNEAILVELAMRPGVDETNIVTLYRKAQRNLATLVARRYGTPDMDAPRHVDDVDDLMILVTENGRISLFD
jgi:hypothetical protein